MKGKVAKKAVTTTSQGSKAGGTKTVPAKASEAPEKRTARSKTGAEKGSATQTATSRKKAGAGDSERTKILREILLSKRDAILNQMRERLGQSLTDDQQRRLESAMDSGDQALFDLEREMGISLQEMRNRERQLIEEALNSLDEGTYGRCAECDAEISEKRLQALPFARYCITCQSRLELLEKIEKGEQRT